MDKLEKQITPCDPTRPWLPFAQPKLVENRRTLSGGALATALNSSCLRHGNLAFTPTERTVGMGRELNVKIYMTESNIAQCMPGVCVSTVQGIGPIFVKLDNL